MRVHLMTDSPGSSFDSIRAIQWQDDHLLLLDQRYLPHKQNYLPHDDLSTVVESIKNMVVRGAPAIGITAAFGVAIAAQQRYKENPVNWKDNIQQDLDLLAGARPTAVNLMWAVEMLREFIETLAGDPFPALLEKAKAIHTEDIQANEIMGELGAGLIQSPCGVLTHCNAGALATGGYGTALGVIRSAHQFGKITQVYADETRPWLQGARLTAWEMVQEKIPVTLLADSAASHAMKLGKIAWIIVGSDRIAANGDVANKIGTYQLAVSARYHGVKFMVVAPTTTVDMGSENGEKITIEDRSPQEVLTFNGENIAPAGANAWNPAFDVTPAALVDAIVTEKGVVLEPNLKKMTAMMEN